MPDTLLSVEEIEKQAAEYDHTQQLYSGPARIEEGDDGYCGEIEERMRAAAYALRALVEAKGLIESTRIRMCAFAALAEMYDLRGAESDARNEIDEIDSWLAKWEGTK